MTLLAKPVAGQEWEQLAPGLQAVTPILACKTCGRTKPAPTGDPTDLAPSDHCGDCPPWWCEDCGQMCSAAELCSCWTRVDGLPLADIKALFANDDQLAIGGLGHHQNGGAS